MAEERTQSFWASLPGILTALAAVISAVGGLVIALRSRAGDAPVTPLDKVGIVAPSHGDAAPPVVAPTPAPAPSPSASAAPAAPVSDSASIVSVSPPSGQRLVVGQDVEFVVRVRYTLRSAPDAFLGVYVADFDESAHGCSGPVRQEEAGIMAPVTATDQPQERVYRIRWRRGDGTLKRDVLAGRGYAAFGVKVWNAENGQAGGRLLHNFGALPGACYPFGPAA